MSGTDDQVQPDGAGKKREEQPPCPALMPFSGGRHPLYPNYGAAEARGSSCKKPGQREGKERSAGESFWG